jgi:hypothetical protein
MPSQPMATWITLWNSRSVNVAGARTRRHTIGLMPAHQTLTCRIVLASAAGSEGGATATEASAVALPPRLPRGDGYPRDPDVLTE